MIISDHATKAQFFHWFIQLGGPIMCDREKDVKAREDIVVHGGHILRDRQI